MAFGLLGGELETMPFGWGLVLALVQVPYLILVLRGGPAVSPPSGSLKVKHFECLSTHVSSAPNPDNYSIESGFSHFPLAWV